MTHPTLKVTRIYPVEVVAYWIKQVHLVVSTNDLWTRGALARDESGRPLETREAIQEDGGCFSLLGAIERYVPCDTHKAVIRVITHVCEERHLGSSLRRINETVSQEAIVNVLRSSELHAKYTMNEGYYEAFEFVELPRETLTAEDLKAMVIELKELEQQEGTLWGDYTCWENITPSLLKAATLRKELLRRSLAVFYGDLIRGATADQIEVAAQALT
jgi:hypothetical protein